MIDIEKRGDVAVVRWRDGENRLNQASDDRGYWCLPEVDLGTPVTDAMLAAVTARLTVATASEALVTGRRYTAVEALAAGIVEHTAAEADVLDRAVELAEPYATKSRQVIAEHKRMLFADAARICGHGA